MPCDVEASDLSGLCAGTSKMEKKLMWWRTPMISAPQRLRQEDLREFKASLNYIAGFCLKKPTQNKSGHFTVCLKSLVAPPIPRMRPVAILGPAGPLWVPCHGAHHTELILMPCATPAGPCAQSVFPNHALPTKLLFNCQDPPTGVGTKASQPRHPHTGHLSASKPACGMQGTAWAAQWGPRMECEVWENQLQLGWGGRPSSVPVPGTKSRKRGQWGGSQGGKQDNPSPTPGTGATLSSYCPLLSSSRVQLMLPTTQEPRIQLLTAWETQAHVGSASGMHPGPHHLVTPTPPAKHRRTPKAKACPPHWPE
ncbi:uncharacterized protein LOC101720604 [Heterocephalus glaber]|uniref:Uncharacterized protein LOC101720604 n=1 Tax=Heterocephalus glaber TaxID=10181 RepID=A0AAX6RHX6_HETGA|nr:uncharacterized protein LOC101720604 [Heterocephalus glaber]